MLKIYPKNSHISLSPHLSSDEFQCRCSNPSCRHFLFDDDLISYYETLRSNLSIPLVINSGHRCTQRNYEVGGKPLSRHLMGFAIDIACPIGFKFDVFADACRKVFPFVLEYPNNQFCHCDKDKRNKE